MQKRVLVLAVVLGLASGGSAFAEQNAATQACAEAIEKAGAKFQKVIYKSTRSCILAVNKCEGDVPCLEKTLNITVDGKATGKCAIGRLDEGTNLYGEDSSEFALPDNTSKIGKAHYRYVQSLDVKCIQNPEVVYAGVDSLGMLFTPADVIELADYYNWNNADGFGCKGRAQVLAEFPTFDTDLLVLNSTSSLDNLSWIIYDLFSNKCL